MISLVLYGLSHMKRVQMYHSTSLLEYFFLPCNVSVSLLPLSLLPLFPLSLSFLCAISHSEHVNEGRVS